eukprot:CAMPEP_0171284142 /NCGR_PEP_ID=MMETSP0790-20130122/67790_1 /TAXON_ID=2925 /ORGANISM="Alexandrium catenella, Strain OF101" /LENGTH=129 /DNA_ID=CAMNT_0011753437 /DNA_START=87 /DNA_END=472 /DNA_ORIENTATION=+
MTSSYAAASLEATFAGRRSGGAAAAGEGAEGGDHVLASSGTDGNAASRGAGSAPKAAHEASKSCVACRRCTPAALAPGPRLPRAPALAETDTLAVDTSAWNVIERTSSTSVCSDQRSPTAASLALFAAG